MTPIYFDHSATTPVDPQVLRAMLPYFSDKFGNASSLHGFGQAAVKAVDQARKNIADLMGCLPEEIVFTSGSTEANNLALKGLIKGLPASSQRPHIITTMIEHDAIIEPCRELVRAKQAEVTYLPVGSNGVIKLKDVEAALKDNTVLVSIMYANSEVGSFQPIKEIGHLIKKINDRNFREWEKRKPADRPAKPRVIYFHTDATQAVNFATINTKELNVSLLSLSGHKIYGPKGVGLLYVQKGTPVSAWQQGGHHERNMRSGTLNVPGIVGLGAALELAVKQRETNNKKIAVVRDYLVEQVQAKVPEVILNTDRQVATPSHAHFSFLGVEGEAVLMALDLEVGVAVSTGSACASSSLEASHVLLAMGIKPEVAHNAVRFTLGKNNTKKEVDTTVKALHLIVDRYRKMAPKL